MLPAANDNDHALAQKVRHFVRQPSFPCVGAKSALARNQFQFIVARDITSAWDDMRIYPALFNFAKAYAARPKLYQSFVVLFQGPRTLDERAFERCLWERVQSLTDKDVWLGQKHDQRVSANVESPHFSLSFGGQAFFMVGLHPKASRPARRFFVPALVFNLHDQFEQLRKTGVYPKLRDTILERDVAMAGSKNPMLQVFGQASEARQYSGRVVDENWRCPFHRVQRKNIDAP